MSYKLRLNKATLEVQQQARKVSIPNQDVKQKKRRKKKKKKTNKQNSTHKFATRFAKHTEGTHVNILLISRHGKSQCVRRQPRNR